MHGVQAVAVESRRTSDYWLRILTQTQGAPSSPEAMPLHTPKADPKMQGRTHTGSSCHPLLTTSLTAKWGAGKESRPRSLGEIVRVGWSCPPEEEEVKCLALVIRAFPSYQEFHIINKSQVQSSKVGVGNGSRKVNVL